MSRRSTNTRSVRYPLVDTISAKGVLRLSETLSTDGMLTCQAVRPVQPPTKTGAALEGDGGKKNLPVGAEHTEGREKQVPDPSADRLNFTTAEAPSNTTEFLEGECTPRFGVSPAFGCSTSQKKYGRDRKRRMIRVDRLLLLAVPISCTRRAPPGEYITFIFNPPLPTPPPRSPRQSGPLPSKPSTVGEDPGFPPAP